MPLLPQPKDGERLQTKGRDTQFSFWPTRRLRAHAKIQPVLFALEPWGIIESYVKKKCKNTRLPEALSCLSQAHDFYLVGTEKGVAAGRPLALYYAYMNLAKVICLTHGPHSTFNNAQHGLSGTAQADFESSTLDAYRSPGRAGKLQNFSELMQAISGRHVPRRGTQYELGHILPQILPGHRLWAQASSKTERFIAFESIQFWRSTHNQKVWLRLHVMADDLSRLSVTHQKFLDESGLSSDFSEVKCDRKIEGNKVLCFEQRTAKPYPHRHPANVLSELVELVKPHLWATVASVPPYRRYYAYLCPSADSRSLLPQLLSVYALTYYLGSITRYRPHEFDRLLAEKFGARLHDFVTGQPDQFLYLLASEILRQDIARPSII